MGQVYSADPDTRGCEELVCLVAPAEMKRAASLINASAKAALSLEEPTYLARINAQD